MNSPLSSNEETALNRFENFFQRINFKRTDGSIYGILVMSESPLSQTDIEKSLDLSQGAISLGLKTLTHYGAIEVYEERREGKRIKLYSAKEDSLKIVATLFRKREQEFIQDFKEGAKELYSFYLQDTEARPLRIKRLESIIASCEVAESIIQFVFNIVTKTNGEQSGRIMKRLPATLDMLVEGSRMAEEWKNQFPTQVMGILKDRLKKTNEPKFRRTNP